MDVPLWSGLRLQGLPMAPEHAATGRAVLSSGSAALASARAAPAATSTRSGIDPGAHVLHPSAPLREAEVALIRQAVQDARGNVAEAARALGISRATVYRKLAHPKTGKPADGRPAAG